jgi:hypothetical protein
MFDKNSDIIVRLLARALILAAIAATGIICASAWGLI